MRYHWSLLLLCCSPSACGSDDDHQLAGADALGSCGVEARLSGGSSLRFTGDDDAACATQHSSESGLEVMFVGVSAPGSFELQIADVTEGETGAEFETRVIVVDAANERFQGNDCSTSVSEHRLLETEASTIGELRHYQVSGEGACPSPLSPLNAEVGEAALGGFAFRAQFTWRD
jgi:hypothetical protein